MGGVFRFELKADSSFGKLLHSREILQILEEFTVRLLIIHYNRYQILVPAKFTHVGRLVFISKILQNTCLPDVQVRVPTYMKYRNKEHCKICGKFLLLAPHIKKAHNMDMESYNSLNIAQDQNANVDTSEKTLEVSNNALVYLPYPELTTNEGTLSEAYKLLEKNKPVDSPKKIKDMKNVESVDHVMANSLTYKITNTGAEANLDDNNAIAYSPGNEDILDKDEMRFVIHNFNSYRVTAMALAVRGKPRHQHMEAIKDFCTGLLPDDQSLLQLAVKYLRAVDCYYRNYRLTKWLSRNNKKCSFCKAECECAIPDDEFYLYCRMKCNLDLECKKCSKWSTGHVCLDFEECKYCTQYAKYNPLSYEVLKDIPSYFFFNC